MRNFFPRTGTSPSGYRLAVVFLVITFLLGGGSRQDIQSLVLLRPFASIVLVWAILRYPETRPSDNRFFHVLAAACVALAVLHLIPLPPGLWSLLPGRDLVARIDEASGIAGTWRPIALAPPAAWNALFSLLVPAAALALALRLSAEELARIVGVFVLLGIVSIVVGLVQMLGGESSPFYLYRIQNTGQLAGLFSNRNHQAIFLACLIPLLGFLAGRPVETVAKYRVRLAGICLVALFVASALVVISSRAGVVVSLVGAITALLLYRHPKISRRTHKHSPVEVPDLKRWRIGGVAVLLGSVAAYFAFGTSAIGQRIAESGGEGEFRTQLWEPVFTMIWSYFPLGAGNGSFVQAYQIAEPIDLLQDNYLNHAHNDWLEVAATVGIPGLAILVAAAVGWARASLTVMRERGGGQIATLGQVGAVIVAMLALASTVDYPLRTPSIACLFVFASVWLARALACRSDSMKETLDDAR